MAAPTLRCARMLLAALALLLARPPAPNVLVLASNGCSAGFAVVISSGLCAQCPAGYICTGDLDAPTPCAPGYYNNLTQQSTAAACNPCPSGFYAAASGATACTLCPAGSQCADPTAAPTACAAGTASLAGSTTCSSCNAGYMCANGSAVACAAGTYANTTGASACLACAAGSYAAATAATYCTACPAGYQCANANADPVACAAGTYASTAGLTSCAACPAGAQCVDRATAVTCAAGTFATAGAGNCSACSSGTYSSAGSGACTTCPAGYYCASPSQAPALCGTGYVSAAAATACRLCPNGTTTDATHASCIACAAGLACPDATAAPVVCGAGTYSAAGDTACHTCPAGYKCASTSSTPQLCSAGTYAPAGSTACTPCPAGYNCANASAVPVACSAGYYSLAGNGTCMACGAGYACPSAAGTPVACEAGTYATSSTSTVCTPCPWGFACPNSKLSPVACQTGQYVSNSTTCVWCPTGYQCTNGSTAPDPCAVGWYSPGNTTSCSMCPAGYACPANVKTPRACLAGTYSLAASTNCTPCPPGYACPSTSNTSQITKCSNGTYSVGSATACTSCPAGMHCLSAATAEMLACPVGYYALLGDGACTACPAGSRCPSTTAAPIACTAGSYSVGKTTTCTSCPAGYSCAYTNSDVMLPCTQGTYSLLGGGACQACPAGYACPSIASSTKQACPSGYYSVGNQSECTVCPAGYACASTTSASMTTCAAGTYSLGGQQTCTPCPAGYYCPQIESGPLPCPAGYYSGSNAVNCTQCTAGYFCTATTQTLCASGQWSAAGSSECQTCDGGYLCLTPPYGTSTPAAAACAAGGWCEDGTTRTVCPDGYYGNVTAAATQDAGCSICPAGSYCSVGSNTNVVPAACPAGSYCPAGTPAATTFLCPAGTYNPSTSKTALSDCSVCPQGFYCTAGTASPHTCLVGYYCPTGTDDAQRHPCPAGYYGSGTGLVSAAQCLLCPAGSYCADAYRNYPAAASPTACPPGSYNPYNGSTSALYCTPCPAGYACPASGQTSYSLACAEGHYCPNGTITPTQFPCPPGTYTGSTSLGSAEQCTICPPGSACGWGTGVDTSPALACMPGYYCPAGTASTTAYPCPPGSWSSMSNLSDPSQCTVCSAGYYCVGGQSVMTTRCLPGYYCPAGTSAFDEFPCPAGYYYPGYAAEASTECLPCAQGSFCESASADPISCPAGTYMDGGSYASANGTLATQLTLCVMQCRNAPVALFDGQTGAIYSVPQCILGCDYGYNASSAEALCATQSCLQGNGFWNATSPLALVGSPAPAKSSCKACPAGYTCGSGTVSPAPCPTGTYTSASATACSTCKAGHYCPVNATSFAAMNATYVCPAGQYCASGLTALALAQPCAAGHYCPAGTSLQINCPVGSYNEYTGRANLSDCLACPAGWYCLEAATTPTGVCVAGFYCPTNITTGLVTNFALPNVYVGSYGPKQEPCPAGTYISTTGGGSLADCTTCPASMYCPQGSAEPTTCPRGYYCPAGVGAGLPCPQGTYSNSTGLAALGDCSACPGGMYCDQEAAWEATAPCSPGYACYSGATTSTPTDGVTGESCPPGGYCPPGTDLPEPCPLGTFNNVSGSSTVQDCVACSPGYYCGATRSPGPTGPCAAGYYCTSGATEPRQAITPAGYYTPSGSAAPIACQPRTYQPSAGTSACLSCPAGYYCPDTNMTSVLPCPAGFFCPADSDSYTGSFLEQVCPAGTYGPYTRQSNSSGCIDCPPGYYCTAGANSSGTTAPTGPCAAGYVCYGSAQFATPLSSYNVTWGALCPAGYYCPEGTTAALPCPPGTYSAATGISAVTQCAKCPAGRYCPTSGMSAYGGYCTAGYYCTLASATPTPVANTTLGAAFYAAYNGSGIPANFSSSFFGAYGLSDLTGDICPAGYYCPTGILGTYLSSLVPSVWTGGPLLCADGTYANSTGASQCATCPSGYYCTRSNPGVNPTVCPAGSYCGAGSAQPTACPAGTYAWQQGLSSLGNCTTCPPGYHCDTPGITATNGSCAAGFWCGSGAVSAQPPGGAANSAGELGGPCPAGYYCPQGTGTPLACPMGTYSAAAQASSNATCTACSAGAYCPQAGLTAPNGTCAAGFYCLGGAVTADPLDGLTGDICPAGYTCSGSDLAPVPCTAGTYVNQTGQTACSACPAGYYCPQATANYQLYPCTAGYYCPAGSALPSQSCPLGTFRNATLGQSINDCYPCSAGMYCGSTGLSAPSGQCAPGWYCVQNATSIQPGSLQGGRCSAGQYCPQGAGSPLACTGGYYCDSVGLSAPAGPCSPGYYCPAGSTAATQDLCPAGAYCASPSASPVYCGNGTFSSGSGASSAATCLNCTAGQYCSGVGLTAPSGSCAAGYYCVGGLSTPTPSSSPCPAGYYCPAGSAAPTQCASGFYQNSTTASACITCQAGYYCDNSGAAVTSPSLFPCPAGYYCPAGTTTATAYPCPTGTLSTQTKLVNSSQCTNCTAGSYCGSPGLTAPTAQCSAGYYCVRSAQTASPSQGTDANICPMGSYCGAGTVTPTPCASGTYGNRTGLHLATDCANCTTGQYCATTGLTAPSGACLAGYYCTGSSPVSNPVGASYGDQCPAGSYCPAGASTPSPCPLGTYSSVRGVNASSNCVACTAGMYCDTLGLTAPAGNCSLGYYCLGGSPTRAPSVANSTGGPCAAGQYCPAGSAAAQSCASGTYVNYTLAGSCLTCPAGFMCTRRSAADACPAGQYCPSGTGAATQPCPAGSYSRATGLSAAAQCTTCDAGKYCQTTGLTAPTGLCAAGYYCVAGATIAAPNASLAAATNETCAVGGGVCASGTYCVNGSSAPVPCAAGTYSAAAGQSACAGCPAGYYCPQGTADPVAAGYVCPAGYYCGGKTQVGTQTPCAAGTFSNVSGATNSSVCQACTPGWYCASTGLTGPTGWCFGGYVCSAGLSTATPASGLCGSGYYCPNGSSVATACPGGWYCAGSGLAAPTGQCAAGYYCTLLAKNATPTDGVTGSKCPAGSYCPAGAAAPTACPLGTYSAATGIAAVSNCTACRAGAYCGSTGLTAVSGNCSAGYYCPAGQTNATPANYTCPAGYYCVGGQAVPAQCGSGTYQGSAGASACASCPAGYYCDNSGGVVVSPSLFPCPQGYYCPSSTKTATQYPCPQGTFSNETMLLNSSQCSPCAAGSYCGSAGLTAPTAPCYAGYYCVQNAKTPTPSQTTDANICPSGYFCPNGTVAPQPCPMGSFGNHTGLRNTTDCLACTAGQYCGAVGMTATSGPCFAGYYCTGGAATGNPTSASGTGGICPAGSYCPVGTTVPTPCPLGTFSSLTGLSASATCAPCSGGMYCDSLGLTAPAGNCTAGYYCVGGSSTRSPTTTTSAGGPCAAGQYCPSGTASPLACTAGTYMNTTRAGACLACPEGYQCTRQSVADPCPAGYYCPDGTGLSPLPCPIGTYSAATKLSNASQCTECDAGKYCQTTGLTAPSGSCGQGFYCGSGTTSRYPLNSSCPAAGDACGPGFYCPTGSPAPIACSAGFYNNVSAASACLPCPAGFVCSAGTSVPTTTCPAGSYCPAGSSAPTPCPPGTYSNATGAKNSSFCVACPAHFYCDSYGLTAAAGLCDAGYYCPLGSSSATAVRCPAGFYCPAAAAAPTACDPGWYCPTDGLNASYSPCFAGYYCLGGSSVGDPSYSGGAHETDYGDICPAGHYCANGTITPTACPPGTYSASLGNTGEDDCLACDAGSYCFGGGSAVSGTCLAGYYCTSGQSSPTPAALACQRGYYCPAGAVAPLLCLAGTYQDAVGQSSCKPCVAGHYCDPSTYGALSSLANYTCPAGSYCPNGTEYATEYLCPPGTFSSATGLVSDTECTECLPGEYCSSYGLSAPQGPCEAGFYCAGGANISRPTDGTSGDICPLGAYCPAGSGSWVACPLGSYSVSLGSTSVTDCEPCEPGMYCPEGRYAYACDAGFVCLEGNSIARPLNTTYDSVRNITLGGYQCGPGTYCPQGSYQEQLCWPGSYNPNYGSGSCTTCPAGALCASYAMATPAACPAGYYCPAGSSLPTPCDISTYSPLANLSDASQCMACPRGQYCASIGLSQPTGDCHAGFLCLTASATPTPVSSSLLDYSGCADYIPDVIEVVIDGAAINETSGLCPLGQYCPAGAVGPVPCPVGTYGPQTGAASASGCASCSAGHYCNITGASQPVGQCSSGYYCPAQMNISTPTPAEFVCPLGYYCPTGSSQPLPCGDGQYQPLLGQSHCVSCPQGHQCIANTNSTIAPVPCPVGFVCPASSGPAISTCEAGTYSNSSGLWAQSQCLNCTAGDWCVNGSVVGTCAAGYMCYGGSSSPRPNGTAPAVGVPCTAGYYCTAGAVFATACPNSTIAYDGFELAVDLTTAQYGWNYSLPLLLEGAGDVAACQPCPAGFLCYDSVLFDCPLGFYCPVGSLLPSACPQGLVATRTRAVSSADCTPCPEGKFCIYNGSSVASAIDCPVGDFCPAGSIEPLLCPNGTYRNIPGAGNITDCFACPGGYYCPAAGMTTPLPCPQAFYCPLGSAEPLPCAEGYYCPSVSPAALVCPGGYYCPPATVNPIACPPGFYCDSNSTSVGAWAPTQCPLGTRDTEYTGNYTRYRLADACTKCPAGKYGNHPQRILCFDCEPGYVCLQGAIIGNPDVNIGDRNLTVNGVPFPGSLCAPYDGVGGNLTVDGYPTTLSYQCPPGYYCPLQSGTPTPCPAGTYRADPLGREVGDCAPCPANTFNGNTGQSACETCGPSSYSSAGATTCMCLGSNRDFNPTGKQCICKPQYAARSGATLLRGSQDGITDCQQIVYDNCPEQTTRNMEGDCLSVSDWYTYCVGMCPSGVASPYYQQELGVCLCLAEPLDAVCNADCQQKEQTMQAIVCTNPPYIEVKDALTGAIANESTALAFGGLYDVGAAACGGLYDGHSVHTFAMTGTSGGLAGVYRAAVDGSGGDGLSRRRRRHALDSFFGFGADAASEMEDAYAHNLHVSDSVRQRRSANSSLVLLDMTANSSQVLNPVVCLALQQVVVFTVSQAHYPIYDKDNLLNRQDNPLLPFDQSPFLDLQSSISQLQVASTTFAYSFTSPGVAVLVDSSTGIPSVFVVMSANTACPSTGPFFPPTASAFHTLGVSQASGLLESPDWALVGEITGGGVGLILLLVGILVLFKRKGWKKAMYTSPDYRKAAKEANFDEFASKGSQLQTAQKANPAGLTVDDTAFEKLRDEFWDYERQVDLEGFDVNTFFAKLDEQTTTIKATLSSHKEEIEALYRRAASQSAALKTLWSNKLHLRSRARLLTAAGDDAAAHAKRLADIQAEMARRQSLGEYFAAILAARWSALQADNDQVKAHVIAHESQLEQFLLHCKWLLEHMKVAVGPLFRDKMAALAAIAADMGDEHDRECLRRGAFCALREPTYIGGLLVAPGQTMPAPLNRLMIAGQLFESELMTRNEHTGLFTPAKGVRMLLGDGKLVDVPPGFFVHPQTARLLPIAGSVVYNPLTHRFITLVDNTQYVTFTDLIPFVPFPEHVSNCVLQPLPPNTTLSYGAVFADPVLGQSVKLLACTVDSTGTVLPVGGTYRHPFTGLQTPIELGLPMLDANNAICPIVAVDISPLTGGVVPLGGFFQGKMLDAGLPHTDPLYVASHAMPVVWARLGGDASVQPVLGTGRTALDNMELAKELERVAALAKFAASCSELQNEDTFRSRLSALTSLLDTVARDLGRVRTQSMALRCEQLVTLGLRISLMQEIVAHRGSLGEMAHPATGETIHLLPGQELVDSDTGLLVPILGAVLDKDEDVFIPLGGVMDNAEGAKVAITIGAEFLDPASERVRRVAGACLDAASNDIFPSLAPCWNRRPRRALAPSLMEVLEGEIIARKSYRRRQRNLDDDAAKCLFAIGAVLLSDAEDFSVRDVESQLSALGHAIELRAMAMQRERKRKAELQHMGLPDEVSAIVTGFDAQEAAAEDEIADTGKRVGDVVRKYLADMQQLARDHKARAQAASDDDDARAVVVEAHRSDLKRLAAAFSQLFLDLARRVSQRHCELDMFTEAAAALAVEARQTLALFIRMTAGSYAEPPKTNITGALEELVATVRSTATAGGDKGLLSPSPSAHKHGSVWSLGSGNSGTRPASTMPSSFLKVPSMLQQHQQQQAAAAAATLRKAAGRRDSQSSVEPVTVATPAGASAAGGADGHVTFADDVADVSEVSPRGSAANEKAGGLRRIKSIGGESVKTVQERQAADRAKLEAGLLAAEREAINGLLAALEQKKATILQDLSKGLVERLADASVDVDAAMAQYEADIAACTKTLDAEGDAKMQQTLGLLAQERYAQQAKLRGAQARELGKADNDDEDGDGALSVDRAAENLKLLAQQLHDFRLTLTSEVAEEEKPSDSNLSEAMEAIVASINASRTTTAGGRSQQEGDQVAADAAQALEEAKDEHRKLDDRERKMRDRIAQRRTAKIQTVAADDSLDEAEKARRIVAIKADAAAQEGALAEEIHARKMQAVQRAGARALKGVSEADAAAVANMVRDTFNRAVSQAEADRARQKEVLQAKMAARRKAREQQQARDIISHAALGSDGGAAAAGDGGDAVAAAAAAAAAAARAKELEDGYVLRQTDIEMRKQARLREMQQQLEQELGALEGEDRAHLEAQLERERAAKTKEMEASFARDVEARKAEMSEAEYTRLVAEHAKLNATMQAQLDKEKSSQLAGIQERLAQRRQRRTELMTAKAETESAREGLQQERALVEALGEEKLKAEKTKLREQAASGEDRAAVERSIVETLQRRHLEEMAQLSALFEQEKTLAVTAAVNDFDSTRETERDDLLRKHSEEMAALVAQHGDAGEKVLGQRKQLLRRDQKRALAAFDSKSDDLRGLVVKDAATPIELAQAHQRLTTKEKQYGELADMLKELSPENALAAQYSEASAKMQREADEYKRKLGEQSNTLLGMRAAKMETEKNERRRAMEAEKKRIEEEMEKERQRQQRHEERMAQETAARKERELKAKEEQLAAQLAQEANETQRRLMIEQHHRELATFNKVLDSERDRQSKQLTDKLAARRERRRQHLADMEAEAARATAEAERTLLAAKTESARQQQQQQQESAAAEPSMAAAGAAAHGMSEDAITQALLQSPFGEVLRKINDIERLVRSGNFGVQPAEGSGGSGGGSNAPVFVDERELAWDKSTADRVRATDIDLLAPTQFVLYRFGVFVARMLATRCGAPKVSILVALDIPATPQRPNAFRNSYYYEAATKVLFIRDARMQHVGDLALVATHALAHIKCGDMDDDRNPAFVREFYGMLRCICHDLFMARARAVGAEVAAHPLSTLFAKTAAEDRPALVNDLVDLKTDASEPLPAATTVKYGGFLSAAALQKALGPAPAAPATAPPGDPDADMLEYVRLLAQEAELKQRTDGQPATRERLRLCTARKEELAARIAAAAAGKR